eukprot:tig00021094_g18093.t1
MNTARTDAWVTVSYSDTAPGASSAGVAILESDAFVGYYLRTASPARSLFVSGNLTVGRSGSGGRLAVSGSSVIEGADSNDLTLRAATDAAQIILRARGRAGSADAGAASSSDVLLLPGGPVGVVSVLGALSTLEASNVRAPSSSPTLVLSGAQGALR